ncbi:hypothetical protein GXM_04378 [Nostoc sphaeroides CCNUC1]|uniref:Uncharacterized protein n=1 Tax=Nostoc sphaeroides CCNUC1 TaxID=2653204 RepID=A0A5P8W2E3_9NOSO|nr:hypothetical protein GXM_04378 [Nostoc sphaeroides CCNUC1]
MQQDFPDLHLFLHFRELVLRTRDPPTPINWGLLKSPPF